MQFDPKEMRARFATLTKQRETIAAKAAPLREERDAFVNDAREKEGKLNAKIAKVEEGLVDIDNERAMISRALGGKTAGPKA